MGYYNIRLSTASQYITIIVTEFGKFGSNNFPMGMCTLLGNFQTNINKLIGDIKGIKTYIGNIIVLSKDIFENHI